MPLRDVTIRRATLDDLESLRGLWREFRLPDYTLEKRFTEFQLAVDPHDWIVGALGLRFSGSHGEVHSLALRRADSEMLLGEALWERVLALAHQQGAYRLWTRSHGPFWVSRGFNAADATQGRDLPSAFGNSRESWWTLKLRDEPLKLIAAEEQLDAYLELERLKTERLMRRGRALKLIATGFAAVLFAVALTALLLLLRRGRRPARRPLPEGK